MPQAQQTEALDLSRFNIAEIQYRALKMLENGVRSLYERELPFTKVIRFATEEPVQAADLFKKGLGLKNSANVLMQKVLIQTAIAPFHVAPFKEGEEMVVYCTCELYEVNEQLKPLHLKIRFGEKGKAKDWQFYFDNISRDGYAYDVRLHPDSENVGKEN